MTERALTPVVVADIGHQLNNMLGVVLMTSLAVEQEIGPEHMQDLEIIRLAGRRCADLTTRLTGRAHALEPEVSVVSVGSRLQHLLPLLRRLIRPCPLTLEVPDEPSDVRIDPVTLDQLLTNLVLQVRGVVGEASSVARLRCQPGSVVVEVVAADRTTALVLPRFEA